MRNLILGYAVGLAQEEIDLFCSSIIMSAKTRTDIVLFGTNIHSTENESPLVRIFIVPTANVWEGVSKDPWRIRWACAYAASKVTARLAALWAFCFRIFFSSHIHISAMCNLFVHPALARYQLYHKYLEANASNYSSVLISDVRDVYFQDDPFPKMTADFASFLEIESSRCSQRTNRRWIKSVYGERVAKAMDEKRVICSGISIGKTSFMQHYLSIMVKEIGVIGRIPYSDQGIHNVLIRLRHFPVKLMENMGGLVLTAAGQNSVDDFFINRDLIVGRDGKLFSLVHQYDRHASLGEAISRQHASRKNARLH